MSAEKKGDFFHMVSRRSNYAKDTENCFFLRRQSSHVRSLRRFHIAFWPLLGAENTPPAESFCPRVFIFSNTLRNGVLCGVVNCDTPFELINDEIPCICIYLPIFSGAYIHFSIRSSWSTFSSENLMNIFTTFFDPILNSTVIWETIRSKVRNFGLMKSPNFT